MQTVGLVETRIPATPSSRKGAMGCSPSWRHPRISRGSYAYTRLVVRRRFHLDENDLRTRLLRPHRRNHPLEVGACRVWRQARSASFAPTSTTTRSAGARNTQSILRTAPALVSPDNPALITLIEFLRSSPSFDQRWKRLLRIQPITRCQTSPKKRTTGVRSAAADRAAVLESALFGCSCYPSSLLNSWRWPYFRRAARAASNDSRKHDQTPKSMIHQRQNPLAHADCP